MCFMVICFVPVMSMYADKDFLKGGFKTAGIDKIGIVNLG